MRFVNPCGRAAPRPDGALRVTVCAEGSLGVTVAEREGRVALRRVGGVRSAAFVASGARLRRGMALLAVDGESTPSLERATELLGGAARPVALDFEVEEVGGTRGVGAANRAASKESDDVRILDVSAA